MVSCQQDSDAKLCRFTFNAWSVVCQHDTTPVACPAASAIPMWSFVNSQCEHMIRCVSRCGEKRKPSLFGTNCLYRRVLSYARILWLFAPLWKEVWAPSSWPCQINSEMSVRKRRSSGGAAAAPKLKSSKSVKDELTSDMDIEYVQMFTENLQHVRI